MNDLQVRLVRSESHDPWFNLALEEYLYNTIAIP